MANPTCTAATLITNAAGYTSFQLDPKQRQCLAIYANALELAAMGGTDYTAALATTLASDAETLAGFMSDDQVEAAKIQIAFTNAAAAGASVPAAIADKLEAVKSLCLHDPKVLRSMELLLMCRLGVHKGYPQ